MPRFEVVYVLLHDDVAATDGGCVLLSDEDRGGHSGADRVGRAVDESEGVTNVEVAEADGLVDDRNSVAQEVHQLPLELKAQISALRADVEEQVARRRDSSVDRALNDG